MMESGQQHRLARVMILGVAMILAGCGGDDTTQPEPQPPTPPFTPAESTTVIPAEDQNTVLAYDVDTGAMTLDDASEYAQNVSVGAVLVGQDDDAAPDGFLRKITGVSSNGGQIVLETEPALLTEAFEQMAISDSLQLRPSQIKSSKLYNGTRVNSGGSIGFRPVRSTD